VRSHDPPRPCVAARPAPRQHPNPKPAPSAAAASVEWWRLWPELEAVVAGRASWRKRPEPAEPIPRKRSRRSNWRCANMIGCTSGDGGEALARPAGAAGAVGHRGGEPPASVPLWAARARKRRGNSVLVMAVREACSRKRGKNDVSAQHNRRCVPVARIAGRCRGCRRSAQA
jgi:hypothetical protein